MAKHDYPGTCYFCRTILPQRKMMEHLNGCSGRQEHLQAGERQAQLERQQIFQLRVWGRDLPEYWWLLEVPGVMSLAQLDRWLRSAWVECCGHMSAFQIGSVRYYSSGAKELDGKTMRSKLEDVLEVGLHLGYEYDFGSTTELKLEVMGERMGVLGKGRVEPLARNVPPDLRCRCGQPAEVVCAFCMDDHKKWMCRKCSKSHDCGEGSQGLMPVVNSPRVGVCGYTG